MDSDATVLCRRCLVRGKVQGVFFRASTAEEARRMGITGHAHNLQDGTVEVLACGSRPSVEALCAWLARGPRLARVTSVACEDVHCPVPASFTTG